jgi:hypothetical protein
MVLRSGHSLKSGISVTFILFSFISLIALVTPVVLNRAYPTDTIYVPVNEPFKPDIFTPSALTFGDAYVQLGIGNGGWATGKTIKQLYNASVYYTSDDTSGSFFSGDTEGRAALIPGLYHEGNCSTLPLATTPSIVNTPDQFNTSFTEFCKSALPALKDLEIGPRFSSDGIASLSISFCSSSESFQPLDLGNVTNPAVTRSAYVFVNTTVDATFMTGESALLLCTSTVSAGTAQVDGPTRAYTSYEPSPLNSTAHQLGEAILHPLDALLWSVDNTASSYQAHTAVFQGMGMTSQSTFDDDGRVVYRQPLPEELGQRLWAGVMHMNAALAILAQTPNLTYTGTQLVATTGRVRQVTFVWAVLGLLTSWLMLLVFTTALIGCRTFGDGLNSYVSARLFIGQGELVEGYACGDSSVSTVFVGLMFVLARRS